MKQLFRAVTLFNLFFLFSGKPLDAQTMNYSVHANIIYRFTKYINWPDDKKKGDFIIGVIGDSPLFEELRNITLNKTTGNQRIVVKKFSESQSSYDCHILFIAEEESGSLKKIASLTQNNSILIVTEEEGLSLRGSCINLVIEKEKLKLEFNKKNIEKRNLNIASELLSLGTIIQ